MRTISDGDGLVGALGERVRLVGQAVDTKAAAAVLGPGFVVLCLDRSSWPAALAGARVTVEGVLEQTDDLTAVVDEDGAISQGSAGGDLVLRRTTLVP